MNWLVSHLGTLRENIIDHQILEALNECFYYKMFLGKIQEELDERF